MIYLLTAVGLSPGGSTHLHTNSTENNTINLGRVRAVPRLCEFYPGICLTTEEKARNIFSQGKKNLSQSTVYILPKHPHITKPTQTHPHITKQYKTTTVQIKTNTVQIKTNTTQDIPK